MATALDMAGEDDDADDLVGGAGAAETAAEIVIPAVVPEGGLPVSEEASEAAPTYLRMQDRSRLNRAVAPQRRSGQPRGPARPAAPSGRGVKEDLVRGAPEAMGEAPDGAISPLLREASASRSSAGPATYFRKRSARGRRRTTADDEVRGMHHFLSFFQRQATPYFFLHYLSSSFTSLASCS